jgi:hypothetical protein
LAAASALTAAALVGTPAQAAVEGGIALSSDAAKVVTVDPASGKVLSVAAAEPELTTQISTHNICNASDVCYQSGKIPYAHQGFYGTAGTATGNWPYRSRGFTAGKTAKFCWTLACSPVLGPNTTFVFPGGEMVTGTSVRIY